MNFGQIFWSMKRRENRWILALLGSISAIAVVVFGGCGAYQYSLSNTPPLILVDQFGYRPNDAKVAVIHQPNATAEDEPERYRHLSDTFQVLSVDNPRAVVFEVAAHPWENGEIDDLSGDRVAWFDFSAVQEPGEYFIRNARTKEVSVPFAIAEDVYRDVLTTATRMYYYQRSGFEKQPPYADARWTDRPAFMGADQDTEARFVNDKDNASLARDLHGGWFDAGDTNKYVTFAAQPLHQLLTAYSHNPAVWTDDFNIPESDNSVPDLLDEIRYELEWFQRMQDDDGGVFIKVGTLDHNAASKPSRDQRPRFYAPKCSSSTVSVASTFAHASLVFADIPQLRSLADTLKGESLQAWEWFRNNPIQTECDSQEIKAGDADRTPTEQTELAVLAAVYLSELTSDSQFSDYIREHFRETRPFSDSVGVLYGSAIVDALLFYSESEMALPDLKQEITAALSQLFFDQLPPLFNDTLSRAPYRAFMPENQYHWGSNAVKSNFGNINYALHSFANGEQIAQMYLDQALGYLHYLHGVNPLGIVYLTNMYDYEAEFSANEMFHEWFGGGIYDNAKTSPSGPAPGYLTGGPNGSYTGPAEELADLPPMRAYLDKNDSDLFTWELSEPSITYQAPYLQLLSNFQESSS